MCLNLVYITFFFQAEDGIRDGHVTGVQTCALPISSGLEPETYCLRQLLYPVELRAQNWSVNSSCDELSIRVNGCKPQMDNIRAGGLGAIRAHPDTYAGM